MPKPGLHHRQPRFPPYSSGLPTIGEGSGPAGVPVGFAPSRGRNHGQATPTRRRGGLPIFVSLGGAGSPGKFHAFCFILVRECFLGGRSSSAGEHRCA